MTEREEREDIFEQIGQLPSFKGKSLKPVAPLTMEERLSGFVTLSRRRDLNMSPEAVLKTSFQMVIWGLNVAREACGRVSDDPKAKEMYGKK